MVIFQAVPVLPEGEEPDPLRHVSGRSGDPRGFVATVDAGEHPSDQSEQPIHADGFIHRGQSGHLHRQSAPTTHQRWLQRDSVITDGSSPEMRIVRLESTRLPPALRLIEGDEKHYRRNAPSAPMVDISCTSLESGDGDIFVTDLETGNRVDLVWPATGDRSSHRMENASAIDRTGRRMTTCRSS